MKSVAVEVQNNEQSNNLEGLKELQARARNKQEAAARNFHVEQERRLKQMQKLERRLAETTDPSKRARLKKRLHKLRRGGRT